LYGLCVAKVLEGVWYAGLEEERRSRAVLPIDKTGDLEVFIDEDVSWVEDRMAKSRFEQILIF
jgi:hypothetical protein